jgi:hypothetical protein
MCRRLVVSDKPPGDLTIRHPRESGGPALGPRFRGDDAVRVSVAPTRQCTGRMVSDRPRWDWEIGRDDTKGPCAVGALHRRRRRGSSTIAGATSATAASAGSDGANTEPGCPGAPGSRYGGNASADHRFPLAPTEPEQPGLRTWLAFPIKQRTTRHRHSWPDRSRAAAIAGDRDSQTRPLSGLLVSDPDQGSPAAFHIWQQSEATGGTADGSQGYRGASRRHPTQ